MSRYLVTGATGFLGAHLVAQLADEGHDVVALARGAARDGTARVTWRRGDVLEAETVRDAAAGCDAVFHCAGRVSRKPEDAEALQRVHVEGTKIALDACKAAGVKRAVVCSTSGTVAVSRDPDAVLDERAPEPFDLVAGWPYYRSKLYAERAALERNGPGFEVVVVNPSLLLGPLTKESATPARGASSTDDIVDLIDGRVPFVPAGGISFVDARDAADGMARAMNSGRAGERYLLTGANMTLAAFFGRVARISGVPAPRLKLGKSVAMASMGAELMGRVAKRFKVEPPVDRISAEMAQHFWYVDASKAKRELGFTARDPGETIAETIADLEQRGVVWPRG